jgi:hypothetical protein
VGTAGAARRCCGRCGYCVSTLGCCGHATVLPRPTVRPTGNDRLSPRVHAVLTRSASTVRTVLAILRYARYSGTHGTRGTRSTRVPLQRLGELGPFHTPRDLEHQRPLAEAATAAQGTRFSTPTYPKYRESPKHGRPTRGSCGSSSEECSTPYSPTAPCRAVPCRAASARKRAPPPVLRSIGRETIREYVRQQRRSVGLPVDHEPRQPSRACAVRRTAQVRARIGRAGGRVECSWWRHPRGD